MYKICFLFFLFTSLSFTQTLEERIYVAAETFISNQNKTTLKQLNAQENSFKDQVKTKDEQLALVFLQSNKAYYLNKQSKLKESIQTYEDALNRFNTNKLSTLTDFDIIEYCLKPLGNLYIKTSDYTNAESIINQYIFLAKKTKNINHQVSGAINLAKLFQTLGNHKLVIKIIDNAFKLPNISPSKKTNLQSIKTTSLVALNKIKTVLPVNSSLSFNSEKNNYEIELQKGNYKNALIHFNKAKKKINESNLDIRNLAKFHFQEAQLYYLLKNKEKAIKQLHNTLNILIPNFKADSLPKKSLLYPENTFIDIFDLYAELQTNPEQALQAFDLSFYVSNLLAFNWTSQESKIFNEANNRKRSEKCIDILFNNFNQTKNKSLLFRALQYSENNKVSTLKEIFQKKLRLQHLPNDRLLNKEFNLLQEQEYITALLIKEKLKNNKATTIKLLNKQLSTISIQLKAIKDSINEKHPKKESTFSLKDIQNKLLKDNAILTEYFFGEKNLYQFIISSDDIILNKIHLDKKKKKSIFNFIHLFDTPSIINNDVPNYTKQASEIYALLNFNLLYKHKNVILIPDGFLNFVPFDALLTSNTSTSLFSKMPLVVKHHNIAYNNSILFYLNKFKKHTNSKVLGFFPVFENTNQTLNYSINEAKYIKKEINSKLFMNTNATKKNFIKNASNYGILHLSTHASGGDFTTPATMQFYNNTLLLNELYSMNISAHLVVLSACETGIGKQYKGEGPMSIARGFQYAGAKSLLFSLWQINDSSTSHIMQLFYKNYKKFHSGFIANQNSKIEYLQNNSISNVKKSPYYWSAFVYYGTPEQAKPKKTVLFYVTFGIPFILFILFLIYRLKRFYGY